MLDGGWRGLSLLSLTQNAGGVPARQRFFGGEETPAHSVACPGCSLCRRRSWLRVHWLQHNRRRLRSGIEAV